MGSWSHRFTERTTMSLRAGPRFTEGAIDPDMGADLSHRWRWGALALGYFRTQSTLAGQAGTVTSQGGRASFSAEPTRSLTVSVAPSLTRTSQQEGTSGQDAQETPQGETSERGTGDITVYSVDASLSYRFTTWLTGTIGYRFLFQDQGSESIRDNQAFLRLDVIYPIRVH
jgi:hypothetical protein